MYLIFWGYKAAGDPDKIKALLKKYAKVLGGSPLNNIYTQYYEVSGGSTISITNPKKQFGGAWEDDAGGVPAHPTDAQVAAESIRGVAHFGYDPNGSYVVATPHGHSSTGFGTQWCAYHSATMSNGQLISYTNLPYMPDANDCGANTIAPPSDESGIDEGVTIVEGHEYAESVTDPNPPTGWYNGQYGEIGDICAWQDIRNDPFGKKSYTSQPMYSNATQSCVHSL
jgi:serine protease